MKTDLKNTTFIVPLRIDTGDRLRNVILSTSYLLHNFDTTVMIKEVDSERRFETFALPIIERLVETDNLVHIFENETRTDDSFHRTKVLNDMVMESKTDIVVNYDTDLILPHSSYINAVQMMKEYDVVYPFRFGNHGERKVNLGFTIETQEDMDDFENCDFVSNFLNNDFDSECFDDRYFYYQSEYIDGYLENEGFIAYAPEDVERHHRWKTLGYKIGRVDNYAYHLEHQRTQNSWYHNPHMKRNNQLWEELKVLTKEQLINYYESQQYYKERIK